MLESLLLPLRVAGPWGWSIVAFAFASHLTLAALALRPGGERREARVLAAAAVAVIVPLALALAGYVQCAHLATFGCVVDASVGSFAFLLRAELAELRGIVWLGAAASLVPFALGLRAATRLLRTAP